MELASSAYPSEAGVASRARLRRRPAVLRTCSAQCRSGTAGVAVCPAEAIAAATLGALRGFKPQELANTAWACARLAFVHEPLLGALASEAAPRHRPGVRERDGAVRLGCVRGVRVASGASRPHARRS